MSSVRRALGFSFIERFWLIGLNLISYVLIARLLTPHQVGVFSVTAALIGIAQVVREFGVGNYLVQVDQLTSERLDTTLGFSILAGSGMALLAVLFAPLAASFYGDPEVGSVLHVLAINFIALPFCSIGQSLLRRSMRFGTLLRANSTGGVAGFATTLGLAFMGYGPVSLAWGSVATNVTLALLCWHGLRGESRPRRLALSHWREVVHFGKQSTAAAVVTSLSVDINDLVIGRVLGLGPAAIMSRAMGLMNLWQRDLMMAARNVAYPAFSKAFREGTPLEPVYTKAYAAVLVLSLPYYGFLALFPLESLRLLAGTQWDAAVPLVPVFAATGAFFAMTTLKASVMLATGRVDLASRADMIVALIRVFCVVVAAFVFRDLMAIALAFLLAYAASPIVFLVLKQRALPTDYPALWSGNWRSAAVTITSLAIPASVSFGSGWARDEPLPLLTFVALAALVAPVWFFALAWWHHPLASDPTYLGARAHLWRILRLGRSR